MNWYDERFQVENINRERKLTAHVIVQSSNWIISRRRYATTVSFICMTITIQHRKSVESMVCRGPQQYLLKSVPHVQHEYFGIFV